ncbi:MAG TPA: NAD(P)H-binding protein, partial [Solirubrobacteraceae bacterium]|nr:NAD(P)H-binding protein [Solirubrobacteraceae bacterium]
MAMAVVVAGGHGQVGRRLLSLLVREGERARGLVRSEEQAERLRALGAEPVLCDLEAEEDLAPFVDGADAVVFSAGAGAGSGPERKRTVDYGAAVKMIAAARAAGVRRYVMVSALGAADPAAASEAMRPYYDAKSAADAAVADSGLDFTIVRPGRLTDAAGAGLVEIAERLGRGGEVPRDDVAAVLLAVLRTDATIGRTFELIEGHTRSIARSRPCDESAQALRRRRAIACGPSGAAGITVGVLLELRVENLLLIERAELRLAPGLNVLTGETGAGKTVLAHALDLLLGGRPRSGIVRPGAAEAYVEGVFELEDPLRSSLGEALAADAEDVVLARRVSAEGRTRAYLNGRSIAVAELRDVAAALISFYGQHEHRRLTLASAQLDVLDGFCGEEHVAARAAFAAVHARARRLAAALAELRELAGSRERELDLLDFELREIEAAEPDVDEERELLEARSRLRHLEALRAAALGAVAAAEPDDGTGAVALLAGGGGALDGVAGVDGALDALAERWRALSYELGDVAAELRRYAEGLDAEGASAGALEASEERLAALDRLKRKHGGS